jgi:hypothetical protein
VLPEHITIEPPPFDAFTAIGISAITIFVAVFSPLVLTQGDRGRALRWFLAILAVMTVSGVAAATGWLSSFDRFPPPMALMVAAVVLGGIALGLSRFGKRLATATPLVALIGLESFRLPLELIMHRAGALGIMPVQLSYGGYNFDIITGLGAIALYISATIGVRLPTRLVWAWNVWGMLCLGAIAIIAVTTSPMVRAFGDAPQQLNTWVLYMPYVWVPVVLVTTAISGHVLITRKLLAQDVAQLPFLD